MRCEYCVHFVDEELDGSSAERCILDECTLDVPEIRYRGREARKREDCPFLRYRNFVKENEAAALDLIDFARCILYEAWFLVPSDPTDGIDHVRESLDRPIDDLRDASALLKEDLDRRPTLGPHGYRRISMLAHSVAKHLRAAKSEIISSQTLEGEDLDCDE